MTFFTVFLIGLAILATYRITRLIYFDDISEGLRGRVAYFASSEVEARFLAILKRRNPDSAKRIERSMSQYYFVSSKLLYFFNCPFCIGVWVGAILGALICHKFAIHDPLTILLICAGIPGGQSALEEILGADRSR